MDSIAVLVEGLGRVREVVHGVLRGASPEALAYRPDASSNTPAWLIWHLTRVQDDHIADLAGREQVWTAGGWAGRFALPFDDAETGYGQDADQVAAVVATPDLLGGYHDAVHDASVDYLRSIGADDLDRVVDDSWDPPVTAGVRLVSVLSDDLQHAGQASYARGLADRR